MNRLRLRTVSPEGFETVDPEIWDVVLVVSYDGFRIAKNKIMEFEAKEHHPLHELSDYAVECHKVFNQQFDQSSDLTNDKQYERLLL